MLSCIQASYIEVLFVQKLFCVTGPQRLMLWLQLTSRRMIVFELLLASPATMWTDRPSMLIARRERRRRESRNVWRGRDCSNRNIREQDKRKKTPTVLECV